MSTLSLFMAGSIPTVHAASANGCCVYSDTKTTYCTSNASSDSCKGKNYTFEAGETNCKKKHPSCQSVPLTFTPNVPIPNLFTGGVVDGTLFGRYVNSFYIYFAGVAGILAVIMIMYGGFHYITSLGNPQRMNQGKEIISNALIGIILVLTSYLLLNIINPRLTKLVLPDIGYYDSLYNTDLYCEAQDMMNNDHVATDAAKAQHKYCNAAGSDNSVTYTDKDGNKRTCYSLSPDPTTLSAEKTANWDKQHACIGKLQLDSSGQERYVYKLLPVAGTGGVCEDNQYTPDESCSRTQGILQYQTWLKGGCKKANVAFTFGITWTGKDVCHYYPFLSCPVTTGGQLSCSQGSSGARSPCWDTDKPRYKADTFGGNEKAYCVDPGVNPTIEHVDSVCCAATTVVCAQKLESAAAVNTVGSYVNVPCSNYNGKISGFVNWDPMNGTVVADNSGPAICNSKCWVRADLYTTTNP